jgi:hypothetical protein
VHTAKRLSTFSCTCSPHSTLHTLFRLQYLLLLLLLLHCFCLVSKVTLPATHTQEAHKTTPLRTTTVLFQARFLHSLHRCCCCSCCCRHTPLLLLLQLLLQTHTAAAATAAAASSTFNTAATARASSQLCSMLNKTVLHCCSPTVLQHCLRSHTYIS